MIANRTLALSTAFAITALAPPAIAAQFDGTWNMVAVTTSGHCGKIPIGLGISHGRIFSTGGRFARYPIQLAGRVSASGQVRMNARASLRGQGGSVGFREAGHGPVAGLPVFAPGFGTLLAFKETGVGRMPSSRCKQCNQPLVEIDHWGERLTGCPTCNSWQTATGEWCL